MANGPDQSTVTRAWRLFKVDGAGRLLTPFVQACEIPAGWTAATCQRASDRGHQAPTVMDLILEGARDVDEHQAPGQRCGCGYRALRTLAQLLDSCTLNSVLDNAALVIGAVEIGGRLLGPQFLTVDGETLRLDPEGTVRAEWMRVAGPLYVPRSLPPAARDSLLARYVLPADVLIDTDGPVVRALLADLRGVRTD